LCGKYANEPQKSVTKMLKGWKNYLEGVDWVIAAFLVTLSGIRN